MPLAQRKWLKLMGILVIGISVGSCQGQKIYPTYSPLVLESPVYPRGEREIAAPFIPTPHPGYGVVVGYLVAETPADLVGLSVFLGDVITLGDGTHGAFLDRHIAPVAYLDSTTGWFVFERVSPGLYALIVSEPELGSQVYMQANDVKVVEVIAGQVVDLGEVRLNW